MRFIQCCGLPIIIYFTYIDISYSKDHSIFKIFLLFWVAIVLMHRVKNFTDTCFRYAWHEINNVLFLKRRHWRIYALHDCLTKKKNCSVGQFLLHYCYSTSSFMYYQNLHIDLSRSIIKFSISIMELAGNFQNRELGKERSYCISISSNKLTKSFCNCEANDTLFLTGHSIKKN